MARARSPNRDKAFKIYKENEGNITNREIAKILNEDEKVIAVWKSRDKWNKKRNVVQQSNKSCTTKEKRNKGGQPNNKNAVGHGAPIRNRNAETHGFFSKYLPKDTLDIIQDIETKAPLDMLWDQITIQYAAIIRAQKIMHVESKDEMIKELKKTKDSWGDKGSSEEKEYEFQFAWDRQATFLNAQSRAISELRSLIKNYLELEGLDKEKSKAGIKDWKSAIQEIAKRREKKQQSEVNSNG